MANCLVSFAVGCNSSPSGGRSIDSARKVTLTELEAATDHLPYFSYLGTEGDSAYFRGDGLGYYQIASEETPWHGLRPSPMVPRGDMELYVTVRDGELTVPGPQVFYDPPPTSSSNWIIYVVAAVILGLVLWRVLSPSHRIRIVIDPTGVRSHRGLPASRERTVLEFLENEVELDRKITIYADRAADGRLQLLIRGRIMASVKQRIRNLLIAEL